MSLKVGNRPVVPARGPQTARPSPSRTVRPAADAFSTGAGRALRGPALGAPQPPPASPPAPCAYVVQPGDSYYRIAQQQATELLAQQGLSPSDPAYSAAWHRLAYGLVQRLMASNGGRPLHPGDALLLPSAPHEAPPVATTPAAPPGLPPAPACVPAHLGDVMVNQFVGDPDGRNGNCGFASSLMALEALGLRSPALEGLASDYQRTMRLRQLGGGGTNDRAWGTVTQVVACLTAAGARASAVPYSWGSDKLAAVDLMRRAFLAGTPTAFVVAGNPALGWADRVSYSGGHFVTVAGYDPATDTFTVMDPLTSAPFQVAPAQLAAYLRDGNAERGELVQVTR